ncbi:MAG: TIGR03943 family protein [Clostridium sp.]|uniref:TIGR03943 family putative permease subunit n=1 Tax=Clostridium sp. TaxID=1506 RepID=UPI0025C4652C|nr:TIGR03943 family protein [Clostridium sp.]MCE5220566.1 TIGR03943 family protein [Clostridium sp.]
MKRFNFDEFLWLVVLILLDLSIIYLIFTGKMEFYIGKKMIKYSYITIVMISIFIIFQFENVFTIKGNNNIKMKLIPIVLTIILGFISINKQEAFKHTELNKELKESNQSSIDMKSLYEHELDYSSIKGENEKKEILIVNEDNPMVLEDIRLNPEKYIGRNLEIHGFVCKESYLNKEQFIIGRIIITCCAADSKIVGIIGEYDKAYGLNENEKINVKGIIESSTIKDDNNASHRIPIIKIEKLEIE